MAKAKTEDEGPEIPTLAEPEFGDEPELMDLDDLPDDDVEALKAERDVLRDRFMRALADAENARKRGERDKREAEQYGGSRLARDMLPVYDNLRRALDAVEEAPTDADLSLIHI